MKFSTILFSACILLVGATLMTEATYTYTTTQAYTTVRTRRTRRATTQAATYATTKATTQAAYTTKATTQAYTTKAYTTTTTQAAYTTKAYTTTTTQAATYATTKATTQAAYTTKAYTTTTQAATYASTKATTQATYTTKAYTTTTTQAATYATTKASTQTYTTKAYTTTTQAATYATTKATTQTYTTKAYTTTTSQAAYTTKAYTTTTPSSYTTTTTETTSTTTTQDMAEVDIAILNFALNLEYLEAEYYLAAIGRTPSYENEVTGNVTGGQQVNFTTPEFRQYAIEMAGDEEKHVIFLRRLLGSRAVDRPNINIAGGANGSFAQAAMAAGINAGLNNATVQALSGFNPYASELFFLHGAFIFEDVGVTAYKGATALLTNRNYLTDAAGILGTEAYHASEVRTILYGARQVIAIAANSVNGSSALRVQDIVNAISGLRGALDGSANGGHDQSIVVNEGSGSGSGDDSGSGNIVPADDDGLVFGRTPREILNIVYGAQNATVGLFFPNGVNGDFSALL